jgi:hypothetical protein
MKKFWKVVVLDGDEVIVERYFGKLCEVEEFVGMCEMGLRMKVYVWSVEKWVFVEVV